MFSDEAKPVEALLVSARTPLTVWLAFFFPAIAGLLFGYDIGAASGAIKSLGTTSNVLSSVLTSSSLGGAFVGTAMTFVVGQPLGRRREIIVGALLYLCGSALTVLAPGAAVVGCVIGGRVLYGLGIAFSMHAAPVYISETAPASMRGLLVSLKEAFIVGGILLGFGVSALCDVPSLHLGGHEWRIIWAVPLPLALAVLAGMWALPPSPRWLLVSARSQPKARSGADASADGPEAALAWAGATDAAVAAMRRLRADGATAELEVAEIVATLDTEEQGAWAELLQARRALLAGLGIVLLQQVTGQPSVLYYQTAIFAQAGFGDFASAASVLVGLAKLVATLVTVRYVDSFGRRPLLFTGIGMMLGALLVLGVAFQFATPGKDGADAALAAGWPPAVVAAFVVYVCGYQVGFGPIAWLLISEIFPLRTRTRALSAAVLTNFGFNLLMTFALQPLQAGFDRLDPGRGASYLFLLYAALCVVSLAFVHRAVPETKGKTLEEIEAMLR